MARAVALITTAESPLFEVARFVIVTGATCALIFAGRFLPF
jgi:hypothetical protein